MVDYGRVYHLKLPLYCGELYRLRERGAVLEGIQVKVSRRAEGAFSNKVRTIARCGVSRAQYNCDAFTLLIAKI